MRMPTSALKDVKFMPEKSGQPPPRSRGAQKKKTKDWLTLSREGKTKMRGRSHARRDFLKKPHHKVTKGENKVLGESNNRGSKVREQYGT